MTRIAIHAEGLSKRYVLGGRNARTTLREALTHALQAPFRSWRRRKPNQLWALRDVCLDVREGEVVGLIGRNGAGKTTLLKLLARITRPTAGYAEIRGRVGSLLEVGTGFHGELTGRENVYLSGAILGMSKREMDRKFDEIVAFAEVEKFLDTSVKHYSSGMHMRLAFAVAAHLEPEILLVDEVLAVGDLQFQKKCLGKMGQVAQGGRTVLFVSHNMAAIENLCKRVLFLEGGHLVRDAAAAEVITHYLQTALPSAANSIPLAERKDRSGNGRIRLVGFHIEDDAGNQIAAARSGMDVVLVFRFETRGNEPPKKVDVGFSIHSSHDQTLLVLYGSYAGQVFSSVPRAGTFRCLVPRLPLSAGRYRVGARVLEGQEEADWPWNGVGYLDVETGDFYGTGSRGFGADAPFLVNGKWEVREL